MILHRSLLCSTPLVVSSILKSPIVMHATHQTCNASEHLKFQQNERLPHAFTAISIMLSARRLLSTTQVLQARLADECGHLRKRMCSCTDNRLVTVVVHLALYFRMSVCICVFLVVLYCLTRLDTRRFQRNVFCLSMICSLAFKTW